MILIDVAEPDTIVNLLRQVTEVQVLPLNQTLRSDYYFGDEEGITRQFGRVQAPELLANIDSMEDELRRYYDNADKSYMIIEGIITDVPLTKKDRSLAAISVRKGARPSQLFTYRVAENGWLFGEHAYSTSAELFYAWLFRLAECGIMTFCTHNYVGTAKLLSSLYHNSQRPPESHNTLNRYYIPRISTGEKDVAGKKVTIRQQNPFIKALMSLSLIYHLDIGEAKATAIASKYRSLYDLAFAPTKEIIEVKGIGKTIAESLQKALGREE